VAQAVLGVGGDQQAYVRAYRQDSCSDDGTQEWLPHGWRVQGVIEKDKGMYDAVNRGWKPRQGRGGLPQL